MADRRVIDHKRGLFLLLVVALILCVGYGIAVWLWYHDWKLGADFGNAFGAANALFSGLALAAVIFTIFLQHGELLVSHDGLKQSVDAQERAERTLQKTMEMDAVIKLFDTYRDLRRRYQAEPAIDWSWERFSEKYPSSDEKRKSYEWNYLADYGGYFQLCGILLAQGHIGDSLVTMLPRAKPLWVAATPIIDGIRQSKGRGLWGSWEFFAQRQEELVQAAEVQVTPDGTGHRGSPDWPGAA